MFLKLPARMRFCEICGIYSLSVQHGQNDAATRWLSTRAHAWAFAGTRFSLEQRADVGPANFQFLFAWGVARIIRNKPACKNECC